MAVFCNPLISHFPSMLLRYCLSDCEMVPVAPVVAGITFAFTFHPSWIPIMRFLYFKVFSNNSQQIPYKQWTISFTGLGTMDLERKAYMLVLQGVSVNYCHFKLKSALVKVNVFIWKQNQSNKQGLEFHIWVALWMTCSMWAPWDSWTAWRRNTNFCTTRVSITLVTCAQLSLILSFSLGSTAERFVLQITPEGSAASDHRIPSQTLSAFLGTQLSQAGRRGSCTDACVDRFEVSPCCRRQYLIFCGCRTDFRVWDEATLTRMIPKVSSVRTHGLLPLLFLPVIFPVARNCSTNVFNVFLAGASLHLYWFLNRIVYRSTKIDSNWLNTPYVGTFCPPYPKITFLKHKQLQLSYYRPYQV